MFFIYLSAASSSHRQSAKTKSGPHRVHNLFLETSETERERKHFFVVVGTKSSPLTSSCFYNSNFTTRYSFLCVNIVCTLYIYIHILYWYMVCGIGLLLETNALHTHTHTHTHCTMIKHGAP